MTTPNKPLAARMRPTNLDDLVGQDHLIYPGSPLRQLVDGVIGTPSVLLYGPPASGKTSLARIIAETTTARFVELSATSAGVKDVRAAVADAQKALDTPDPQATVLFIDEVHRFSKAQQDILLPAVERGTVSMIGATTENPSFSVNPALRSRAILLTLKPLGDQEIITIIDRALVTEHGLPGFTITDEAATTLAAHGAGDARQSLAVLELASGVAAANGRDEITVDDITTVAPTALLRYDHDGDQHYDIVSAFIKSMRGSDPDAALHWLARLIESGEDPRFIARRILIHASEDVGMADPSAIWTAHAASYAVQTIGLPEARINLAQAVIHIATAPKSNTVIAAINAAQEDIRNGHTGAVPKHLRDAHYPGAAALGHGSDYLYPHDYPHGVDPGQSYSPEGIETTSRYYQPKTGGAEGQTARTMAALNKHKGR